MGGAATRGRELLEPMWTDAGTGCVKCYNQLRLLLEPERVEVASHVVFIIDAATKRGAPPRHGARTGGEERGGLLPPMRSSAAPGDSGASMTAMGAMKLLLANNFLPGPTTGKL